MRLLLTNKSRTINDEAEEAKNVINTNSNVDFGNNTLNLNIPNATSATVNWVGINVNAGNVVFSGGENRGIITAPNGELYDVVIRNGADLTINGGQYIGGTTAVQVSEDTLTINGGYFDCSENGRFLINCIDDAYRNDTANVVIKGGIFVNWNPADNASEGTRTNFLAEGYTVVAGSQANGDTWYTVVSVADTKS